MFVPNPHGKIDAENREHDRRIAAVIRGRPEVIQLALRNLRKWAVHWGQVAPPWEEWEQLLRMLTPSQVADFLESDTPKANRLRQSSPFIGVLEHTESHTAED